MSTLGTTAVNSPDDPFRDDAQVTDTEALSLAAELFGEGGRMPDEWFGDTPGVAAAEDVESTPPEATTALSAPASGGSLADLMQELALLAARRESPLVSTDRGGFDFGGRATPARSAGIKHLVFQVGAESFAVPMSSVLEVMAVPEFVTPPFLAEWIAGVIHWRGEILSLVDFVAYGGSSGESTFDAESAFVRAEHRSTARVVVVRDADDTIRTGLIVPRVVGLRAFASDRIRPVAPSGLFPMSRATGLVDSEGGAVVVLDIDGLLGDAEFQSVSRR